MKILYIDMDNVLVDFSSGIKKIKQEVLTEYEGRLDEVPNIFSKMVPYENAVQSVELISKYYDTYILSTAPWLNSTAWSDKLDWVKKFFPIIFYKRLILSHHKNLNKGDFLVDDRTKNGADKFDGELLLFGSQKFPNWLSVNKYLIERK